MGKWISKAAIYTALVSLCIILCVQLGGELILQIAMMIEGVPDRSLLDKESGAAMIAVYAILPESIAGFIGGWYLAEWISEKIWVP